MDNSQIRLRWTSHQGTVLSIFDALLSAETLVDVTLCADGQYVKAHKIVLSACSPYFQEVLSLELNKTPIIFLKDVKYSELKALVQYMYRGEVNISQDELSSLLAVAQSLKIRGLADVENSNNMGSDTLIMPEMSNSRGSNKLPGPSGPPPMTSAPQHPPVNVQLGLQQVQQQQHSSNSQPKQTHISNLPQAKQSLSHVSISSIPQQAKSSEPRSSGPSASIHPPAAKRLRTHQQQLEPVTVTITPSIPQTHNIPSQLYDPMPMPSASTSHYDTQPPDQPETHFTDEDVMEQPEPMYPYAADDVKVEIEEGLGQAEHDVGEDEDNDNSMSQSSFSDSWKHDEAHGSQSNMMGGDGEMPGGSGSAQDPGTSAGGEGEGWGENGMPLRGRGLVLNPRGRKRSLAHDHFRLEFRNECFFHVCVHCGQTFKKHRTSCTSSLLNHMRSHHRELWNIFTRAASQ